MEVGVGVSFGAKTGAYVYASAGIGSGEYNYNALTYNNTQLSGNTVNLTSQNDTTLKGATVTGNTITADVGGKLSIESLQDQITQSSQDSIGARVQVGFGTAWEVSGSLSQANANGSSSIVNQQSGLFAGDGGYHVTADTVELTTDSSVPPLFRGTSEGYQGNSTLQQVGVTPTSTNLAVATVFGTQGQQYGNGIVHIALTCSPRLVRQ